MGYYFMKYSFIKRKNSLFFSYLISYFLHSYYNYFAVINYYFMFFGLILGWVVALKLFINLKKNQRNKRHEYEKKI